MGNLENYVVAGIVAIGLMVVIALVIAITSPPLRIGDDFEVVGNSGWYVCVISEVESDLELQCLKTGE